ncbi:MAG TPA: LCP family protein [Actinomycetota bacterium]|nr:LCP family protein [Actinomycetota bacterium]
MITEEEMQSSPELDELGFEPGGRTRRNRRRRRRSRAVALLMVMVLAAGAAWAVATWLDRGRGGSGVLAGDKDGQTAILFMIRQADDPTRRSDMLVVFALDAAGTNPITLFMPTNALTEIPGHGLDLAGRGFQFGGMRLQSLVVDNVLGIVLDRDAAMTDAVLGKLVDAAGGLDITVEDTLIEPGGGVAFSPGLQKMNGEAVRGYLRYQGDGETELSRIARAQHVWEAMFAAWGRLGVGALAEKFREIGSEWNEGIETGLTPLDLAEFFSAFTAGSPADRIYTALPVEPVSAGGSEQALRIDEDQVGNLVSQYFAASIPKNPYLGTRIEVLNGNGIPQIGEEVALKLIPKGYRIVLNKNARSFDFETTKIVVYSRDERSLGAARKIQELLGVGEIEIGTRAQTVVDVTIVVGHDFEPRD